MIRLTKYLTILAAFLLLLSAPHVFADSETDKALAANRTLSEHYRERLSVLQKDGSGGRSPSKAREIADLEYKIKALEEDRLRISSALSTTPRQNEPADPQTFLRQLIARQAPSPRNAALAASKADKIAQLHELALERVVQNDLATAIRIYEEIILEDGTDDQAYFLMGHCLMLSGMYEKAETAYFHSVELAPQNRAEIVPFYENAVLKYPDDDTAHSDLGYAWLMLGDYLKAKEAFRDALDINPANQAARDGLGLVRERGN